MKHTGYTSYIIDHNLKASEFLRLCLRAFNIFVEYRDEPLSPVIPKELPKDDWHEKELVKAKEKLAQRLVMTDDEWRKELENDLADNIAKHKEAVEKENAEMARLNAVKEAIEGWKCSEAYDTVKNFALEQIAKSEPNGYKWYTESEECLRKALDSQEEFEKYNQRVKNEEIKYANSEVKIENYKFPHICLTEEEIEDFNKKCDELGFDIKVVPICEYLNLNPEKNENEDGEEDEVSEYTKMELVEKFMDHLGRNLLSENKIDKKKLTMENNADYIMNEVNSYIGKKQRRIFFDHNQNEKNKNNETKDKINDNNDFSTLGKKALRKNIIIIMMKI